MVDVWPQVTRNVSTPQTLRPWKNSGTVKKPFFLKATAGRCERRPSFRSVTLKSSIHGLAVNPPKNLRKWRLTTIRFTLLWCLLIFPSQFRFQVPHCCIFCWKRKHGNARVCIRYGRTLRILTWVAHYSELALRRTGRNCEKLFVPSEIRLKPTFFLHRARYKWTKMFVLTAKFVLTEFALTRVYCIP